MKVALHVDGAVIRGNERQVLLIVEGLTRRGHRVVASCRAGGAVESALRAAGARTTGVRPGGDADAWNALRFAGWLRAERPEAVLLTSWKRAWAASVAARAAGVPRVLLRVGDMHTLAGGPGVALRRLVLRRFCTGVVANSSAVAEHFRPVAGRGRVHTVPNGIVPPVPGNAPVRARAGIPEDAPLALAVGGAEPKKGFDLLVEGASAVDPEVHLLLVGGGRPDHVRALRERIAGAGLGARAHLLPWSADVPSLLAAADVFVLSSRSEGMSVAMLEAMAVGTPVLAADVGGVRDALAARDGRPAAGWIVPAEDARALGEGLRSVLAARRRGDRDVRARVAEARWRVDTWFGVDRMVDAYEALLEGRVP
jgi:glycosyltransferase involved in cell wall biosynthesis